MDVQNFLSLRREFFEYFNEVVPYDVYIIEDMTDRNWYDLMPRYGMQIYKYSEKNSSEDRFSSLRINVKRGSGTRIIVKNNYTMIHTVSMVRGYPNHYFYILDNNKMITDPTVRIKENKL